MLCLRAVGEPRTAVFVPGMASRIRLTAGMPRDPVNTVLIGRDDPTVTFSTKKPNVFACRAIATPTAVAEPVELIYQHLYHEFIYM